MADIINKAEQNEIRQVLNDAISKIKDNEMLTLSDLFIMANSDEMVLSVFTDDEQLLSEGNIDSWSEYKDKPEIFQSHVVLSLKNILNQKDILDELKKLDLLSPFSVILVDENFEQTDDLLTIDDSFLILEDDFIKNIDKELDSFLDNLLKDV